MSEERDRFSAVLFRCLGKDWLYIGRKIQPEEDEEEAMLDALNDLTMQMVEKKVIKVYRTPTCNEDVYSGAFLRFHSLINLPMVAEVLIVDTDIIEIRKKEETDENEVSGTA